MYVLLFCFLHVDTGAEREKKTFEGNNSFQVSHTQASLMSHSTTPSLHMSLAKQFFPRVRVAVTERKKRLETIGRQEKRKCDSTGN